MRRLEALSLSLLLLAGCRADPGLAGPPDAAVGATDTGSSAVDTNLPPGEPTYYGMVDDILAAHCWGCHSAAGGGIAPYPLDTYADASSRAVLIAQYTGPRLMPPFFAVNDGSCQTFEDHGRWLSDAEIATLDLWRRNGAPEGDPSTPPPTVMTPPTIATPTFTLQMPQAFTPRMTGTDPNEFRCFVIDPGQTSDAFITSYEVVPGTASVVHHVIVYEPETDTDASSAAAMEMPTSDPRPGYPCSGGPAVPAHPVALWAPGGHRTDYPATTGLSLPAGRRLILQIHYNVTNGAAADQTSVRFLTTPSVTRPAQMILLSQNTLSIPPRETLFSATPRTINAPGTGQIWGVFPHMHRAGRELDLTVGSTCLVHVRQWDFNWQQAYFYTTPVPVTRGDHVTIQCRYNTMTRTATTTFGEGTEDEMCLAFFYVTGP